MIADKPVSAADLPESHKGKLAFTPERMKIFKETVAKYEVAQSALLPTLHLAQEQWGFLSTPVLDYVADLLKLTQRHVYECATFYTMFRKKDWGKYHLQVCQNISCTLMGGEAIFKVIEEELGIKPGQVTADKKFGCMPVECLGSCDTAPVCQINDDYAEKLSPEKFREILRALKAGDESKLKAAVNV